MAVLEPLAEAPVSTVTVAVTVMMAVPVTMPATLAVCPARSGHDLRLVRTLFIPLMRDTIVGIHVGDEWRANDAFGRFTAAGTGKGFRGAAHGLQLGERSASVTVVVV